MKSIKLMIASIYLLGLSALERYIGFSYESSADEIVSMVLCVLSVGLFIYSLFKIKEEK